MIQLLFHVVTCGTPIPATQHLASEPDIPGAVLRKGRGKTRRVAVAIVLGITLQIASGESAKGALDTAHSSAGNPYPTVTVLEDAFHTSLIDGRTGCLAVLEAVQATIGAHP